MDGARDTTSCPPIGQPQENRATVDDMAMITIMMLLVRQREIMDSNPQATEIEMVTL